MHQQRQNHRLRTDSSGICWMAYVLVCLFVWIDSLRPINNRSVIKGRVSLGWTSSKLGLMFLLKDTTQWRRWGSKPRPLGLDSNTLPLSHCAPTYLGLCVWFDSLRSINKLSYIGTGFPGLNQYWARINLSCLRTQGSDAGEARTRGPSVSSQALYHWATALPHILVCVFDLILYVPSINSVI